MLVEARGPDFDRQWLEQMIEHHEGAIMMAEEAKAGVFAFAGLSLPPAAAAVAMSLSTIIVAANAQPPAPPRPPPRPTGTGNYPGPHGATGSGAVSPSRKRPDGALESDVLGVLWASGDIALSPGEVNERLDVVLAYTTVMTVLTRLWKKGLAERIELGRGYGYRAAYSESELATQRIRDTLDGIGDRASALAGFLDALDARDVNQLRQLLAELDGEQ